MAAPHVVISTPQNRQRDCYASAPNLDLTLRSNGEESVQIMDSFGQFTRAGFDPPSVAPTVALNGAGNLTNNMWVGYIYVYAARARYPYVDAGVSVNGSIAPRSNPSPSETIQITGGNKKVDVTVFPTQRPDISNIWIFRTSYFSTDAEATDAVNAGTAFFIGEVVNNPNLASIIYSDNTAVAAGEECEIDNFAAPQFRFCVFFDPYFWGFGNPEFTATCLVDTGGNFLLVDQTYKLFDGRNGQQISFVGITSGGYDGHGNYYFKQTGDYTGQCYLDIALTITGSMTMIGATTLIIKGQANILYRSKAHNPLSWGKTDVIDDIRIPSVYAFRIGGGNGTALAIIANLNLLKLDTEAPSISYILNLRLAGSGAFEDSKRELSRGYSVSNHFAQFPTVSEGKSIVLWGYDFKTFSILECDGSSQRPISDRVFETLRGFDFSRFNHGIYDNKTELAAFWYSSGTLGDVNDVAVLYHTGTDTWSLHTDFDVSCAATIFDSVTNEHKTIVGTKSGLVGQAFVDTAPQNWVSLLANIANPFTVTNINPGDFNLTESNAVACFDTTTPWYWVGNYLYLCQVDGITGKVERLSGSICKIVELISNTTVRVVIYSGVGPGSDLNKFAFIGNIPVKLLKFTQFSSPTQQKQLTEMFMSIQGMRNLDPLTLFNFRYGVELQLSNIFSTSFLSAGTNKHFSLNTAQALYNQNLNPKIEFSSIIGMQLEMINEGNALIELKDYSVAFQNA